MTITIARARPHRSCRRAATAAAAALVLTGGLGACTWRGRPPPRTTPTRPPAPSTTPTRPPAPSTTPTRPTATTAPTGNGWSGEMLASVNAERAKAGASPLVLCGTLNVAAQRYAEEMAARGVLSHTGANGSNPGTRLQAAGYRGGRWAENIAQGYPTVPAVMAGWIGSAGHKANILAQETRHLGVGRQGNWWVQNFGAGGTC